MQLCHTPRTTSAVFDDPNLVSSAGLVPVLARDPGSLCAALRAEGFDATRGTTSMRVVEAPGAAPGNARRLLEEVAYLPVSALVPDSVLARLAALTNRLAGAGRRPPAPLERNGRSRDPV